jgi:hypothetical protein
MFRYLGEILQEYDAEEQGADVKNIGTQVYAGKALICVFEVEE